VRPATIIRYGLWAAIVATANANRRFYGMKTTWLPHLLANSLTLLLPELSDLLAPRDQELAGGWRALHTTLAAIVRDNPSYVAYVAPLAAGYLLSHPQFNIYKGALGELRLAGFGLDALPHIATAFALTALVGDSVHEAARNLSPASRLGALLGWSDQHQARLSAAVLAVATIGWELGEYLMHRSELAQRGDPARINMQWSVNDMVHDCAANFIGWGLATAWRSRRPVAAPAGGLLRRPPGDRA
jgi:hypothetical protein